MGPAELHLPVRRPRRRRRDRRRDRAASSSCATSPSTTAGTRSTRSSSRDRSTAASSRASRRRLWEEAVYDDAGQLLTSSLLDYLVPSAAELPSFELDHTVTPSPTNPLGVKGIGEAGTIASTPAVINAVVDALSHLGVTDITMPATPERVWTAIHRRGGRTMIPAPFEYVRADSADRGARADHRARRRGEVHRGRHVAHSADEAAARDADGARRRRPAARPVVRARRRRHVAIGALTRHRDLETDAGLAASCGVLQAVAAQVGDNQVRHRGTIGGSVAHGDPASDLPAALLALDAEFVVRGPAWRAHDSGFGVLRRLSRDRARSRRAARRDPRSCDREQRLLVPEVQPAGAGLGDRRRARGARQRIDARRPRQHGINAVARDRGGAGARGWRVGRRCRRSRPTPGPSPRPTSTRRSSTGAISRACSCGGRSRQRSDGIAVARRARGRAGLSRSVRRRS